MGRKMVGNLTVELEGREKKKMPRLSLYTQELDLNMRKNSYLAIFSHGFVASCMTIWDDPIFCPKNQPGSQVTGGKRRSQTTAKKNSKPLQNAGLPVILRVQNSQEKNRPSFLIRFGFGLAQPPQKTTPNRQSHCRNCSNQHPNDGRV